MSRMKIKAISATERVAAKARELVIERYKADRCESVYRVILAMISDGDPVKADVATLAHAAICEHLDRYGNELDERKRAVVVDAAIAQLLVKHAMARLAMAESDGGGA